MHVCLSKETLFYSLLWIFYSLLLYSLQCTCRISVGTWQATSSTIYILIYQKMGSRGYRKCYFCNKGYSVRKRLRTPALLHWAKIIVNGSVSMFRDFYQLASMQFWSALTRTDPGLSMNFLFQWTCSQLMRGIRMAFIKHLIKILSTRPRYLQW